MIMLYATTSEAPEDHYIGINAFGHIVLDLGAGDFGRVGELPYPSTVEYWNRQGAKSVIAIDSDQHDLDSITEYATESICMRIRTPDDIESLLTKYQPTFVKCDIEKSEAHLCLVPNNVFRIPEVYAIETHSERLYDACWIKLIKNDYSVKSVVSLEHTPEKCKVIIAEKEIV